jgi:hypothetical protein
MEVIVIMSWRIWTVRNDAIFQGISKNILRCLENFKQVFGLLLWHAKKKNFPQIEA